MTMHNLVQQSLRKELLRVLRNFSNPQTVREIRYNLNSLTDLYELDSHQFIRGNLDQLIKQGKICKQYFKGKALYSLAK